MYRKAKKLFAVCLTVAMLLTMTAFSTVASAATSNRLEGADRYATALNIVKAGWSSSEYAVLATGEGYADALAAAPLAKAYNAPILLVDPATDNAAVKLELATLGVKTVFIVGGEGVVSKTFADGLTGYAVNRLAGDNRVQTSVKVAAEVVKKVGTISEVVVANEEAYADALSIAPIAANRKAPILLTYTDSLPTEVSVFLADKTITKSYVVGETGVVSDAVKAVLPYAVRLGGANRYATNYAVLSNFADLNYANVFVTTGENYPDALAGSAYAAKLYAPVVLVDQTITADTLTLVKSKVTSDSKVFALGGAAVCPESEISALVSYINGIQFKVTGVTAINAKQLKVTFSQKVNATEAAKTSYYLLNNSNVVGTVSVASDGLSAVITLTTALANKTTYVYQVSPIVSADGAKTTPVYTTTEYVNDVVAPAVKGTSAITNGTSVGSVTVSYSEPVQSGIVKIDGKAFAVTAGKTSDTFTITLDASKTHTLEAVNFTDYAGNVAAYASQSFTVTVDNVSPLIASVAPYSDKAILVTFSKKMNSDTVTVLNTAGNVTLAGEMLETITAGTAYAEPSDTTGTQFVIPVNTALYGTLASRTLTVVFKGAVLTDTLGNKVAAAIRTVVLTKDTVAPYVTDVTFVKNSTTNKLESVTIKYSEALTGTTVNPASLTIVDKNGVLILGANLLDAVTIGTGVKEVTFGVKAGYAPNPVNGVLTVTVPAGLVTDLAETPNSSTGFNKVLDLTDAATATSPLTFAGSIDQELTDNNILYVNYTNAVTVKGGAVVGSSTDVNNYSINGVILTGATITLFPGQHMAKIVLPDGFLATSDSAAIVRINGVQTTDGVAINPVTTTVSLKENKKPVLSSAVLNADGTITVAFSETVTGADATDMVLKVNGTASGIATFAKITAGADAGKYLLTPTADLTASSVTSISVATASGANAVDAAGNVLTTGTTIVVK